MRYLTDICTADLSFLHLLEGHEEAAVGLRAGYGNATELHNSQPVPVQKRPAEEDPVSHAQFHSASGLHQRHYRQQEGNREGDAPDHRAVGGVQVPVERDSPPPRAAEP